MPLNRRKIRELAMQTLFLWDTQGEADAQAAFQLGQESTEDPDIRKLAMNMVQGAWSQRESIDAWIERLAPQWPPRRQPAVDRNLLRLAVWELTNTPTPPKVVIDEAIELAKHFSTENSGAFVNGVLDSVLREHQRMIQGGSKDEGGRMKDEESSGSRVQSSANPDAPANPSGSNMPEPTSETPEQPAPDNPAG